jgi:hypothetical protein
MAMRELTEEERKITEKSIERMDKEKEYLDFQKAHKELMLKDGLRINYERHVQKHEQELKDINDALGQIEATVGVANKQLSEGVEVVEDEE